MLKSIKNILKDLPSILKSGMFTALFIAFYRVLVLLQSKISFSLKVNVPAVICGKKLLLDGRSVDLSIFSEIGFDKMLGFIPSGRWCIIDVGAHIGLSTVVYASYVERYGGFCGGDRAKHRNRPQFTKQFVYG